MEIEKCKSEFGRDICIKDNNKTLTILYGRNLDIYWILKSDKDKFLNITKENYELYDLFNKLFEDISNINIFDSEYNEEDIEHERKLYRNCNQSNYNELYNKEKNIITWFSDSAPHEVCNVLKIKKFKNSFRLEFYTQKQMKGYEEEYNLENTISIRFRNSGSRYAPFNIIFMKMYLNLQKIDDVNDYGHQMHIEEHLNKIKKLNKC